MGSTKENGPQIAAKQRKDHAKMTPWIVDYEQPQQTGCAAGNRTDTGTCYIEQIHTELISERGLS